MVSQAKRYRINGCGLSPTIFDDTEEKRSGKTFPEAHFAEIVIIIIMLMIAILAFLARGFGTSNYEKESHLTELNFNQKVTLETANVDIIKMR